MEGFESDDDWKRALDTAARFHRYSFANSLLIVASHARAFEEGRVPDPEPDVVAGFHAWKALGRHVVPGQHGHTILCPRTRRIREAVTAGGATRPLDRGEQPRPGESASTHRATVGWSTGTVFSRSQTEGAELSLPTEPMLLQGEAPAGLWDGLATQVRQSGFELSTVPNCVAIDGANGVTDFGFRKVQIRQDMDESARAKTLAHELAHIFLHAPIVRDGRLVSPLVSRDVREVEAESVAYLVGSAHGMSTTAYTLPYVAAWAGGVDPASTVRATAERVVRAARGILDALQTDHGLGGRPPGIDRVLEVPPGPSISPTRKVTELQGLSR